MNHDPSPDFMRRAIVEAKAAQSAGDYAIGAVVVLNGEILAASGNRIKLDCDPTQHAEIAAIRHACAQVGRRHIHGAILYTTAEPCPMCAAAVIWACMDGIVSGSTIEDMVDSEGSTGIQSGLGGPLT